MIPAEAVEAAAKAMRANEGYNWDDMGVSRNVEALLKETYRKQARNVLEAAAPYIRAQAFEVSTIQELDALWLGSVVLSQGVSYQRYGNNEWAAEGAWYETGQVELPATVLHDPRNYRPAAERAPYMLNTEGEK